MDGATRLGDWTCPSGNNVELWLLPDSDRLLAAWDTPPPLGPGDLTHYHAVIRPAMMLALRLSQEITGRIVVLDLP